MTTPLYKRASAPIDERIADLLSRMTLEEKITELRTGIAARRGNAVNETRLGIPILFHDDGAQCNAAASAAGFPQAIALASSWDPTLLREVSAAVAWELRARGVRLVLAPALDIARDPRHGCIEQTFGEDPYLVGEMGVAAVEGLQGTGNPRSLAPGKVLAAAKHLAGHDLPGDGIDVGPAPLSERELREVFFPPFEEVIKRTGIDAVVASRNEIDGVPSHANTWLLQDVLRREWKFGGAVLGDRGAIGELQSLYHVAASPGDAALLALEAGVDADLPDGHAYETLADAVRAGRVPQSRVDAAVGRVLALKFRAGLFEHADAGAAAIGTRHHNAQSRALALKAAQRSITLLKNDGALPLALPAAGRARPKIAVIELGSASILDGIRAKARGRADVVVAQGTKVAAVKAAKPADRVVLAIGGPDLSAEQQELVDALKALGKPIVVVLVAPRPAASVKVSEQANALVAAWGLGEQGGKAVADVLFGDVNPGGKLPVTLARNAGQLPMFYNVKPSARRGYLFDSSEPLYPFGWGLSYSTFELGAPRLSAAAMGTDGSVQVSVDVRNSGRRTGDETVQLYIRDKVSSVTRPVKQLKGFQRVSLAPGEQRTVTFMLSPHSLEMWDDRMRRVVEPGEFEVMTGTNSAQLKSVTLTILERPEK